MGEYKSKIRKSGIIPYILGALLSLISLGIIEYIYEPKQELKNTPEC